MELGCFSVSLTVKNLQKSREFYETLGFKVYHGDQEQGWLIMKSPTCNIGLFEGMFEKNILTFNPGWDQDAHNLESFTDIRVIAQNLKKKGIEFVQEITPKTEEGPASFSMIDPDGNPILIDQHR